MGDDVQEETLSPVPQGTLPPKPKIRLTGREARRKRRTARRRYEEMLAWVLVPVILLGIVWGITSTLDYFGTTPGQVWDQLQQVKQALEKKAKSG